MQSSSGPTHSQYHHFIPRFILRNFSHPFRPPNDPPRGSAKRGRPGRKKRPHPNEPMLHIINLGGTTAEVTEAPVSRTLGLVDMYRGFSNATNQHYLEEQLARLESRAGQVVSKIRKAFEAGQQTVWITRPERDILRKFLFIMKYRGMAQRRRFYHQSGEGYSANDKERLLEYMCEKGYQRPIDIWFDNIKAMLELKMDPKLEWMEELKKRAYPDDAMMFIAHTQMMYLALCTPSALDDEFLLTENAYSIFEGRESFVSDEDTGEMRTKCYTEFHVFAVISPKLIMVLRSFILPIPEEDSDEDTRHWRETMFQLNAQQHNFPEDVGSILEDLPITKARNSYTRVVDGRLTLVDGEDGSPRLYHKFCFQFFPISTEHVNKINSIMLEQSFNISTILFKSELGTRKTLEYYLSKPCIDGKGYGFKIVDGPNDPRLVSLRKLEEAARQLGSNTKAVYRELKLKNENERFEALAQMLEEHLPKEPTETMKLYMKLGGSAAQMPKDMDQAAKMVKMRIKIDVWSKGLDEEVREEIRDNLRDLFCQLPSRRALRGIKSQLDADHLMEGPEDVIVNVSHLISANHLCRLMFFATLNHIHLIKNPDFDLAAEITLDENGGRRLQQAKTIAFGPSGSICDCAISAIEEKAKLYRDMARATRCYQAYRNPFWPEEENVEMIARVLVLRDFSDLLANSLSPSDMEPLKKVLFGVIYPTLGCTWS